MGPLAVVDPKPSVGQGAQLRQRFEEVRVQHLGPVAPIETFDIGVLARLAGLDVVHRDAVLGAPVHEGLGGELGPVIEDTAYPIDSGDPNILWFCYRRALRPS